MIKAGLIGFGRMGITHFSILNTHPQVKIMAVCDQSSTMLRVLGKYVDVKTYTDYPKMLDDSDLDCVLISTPGDSHAEIVKTCLKQGLHVFVEKPFTLASVDGHAIMAELTGKSLVNQVGYVNRFNEVFMEVKQLIDAGAIGDVVNFSSEMYGATVLKDSKSSWRGKREKGGGCMIDFASHCIDLVVYLFDKPDKVVGSIMQSIYSSEVEDLVSASFIYAGGYSGNIYTNWSDETYRKPTNILKVLGTKGKIIADKHAYKIYLKESDPKRGLDQGWNTRYITDFGKTTRFYLRGNEFTNQLDYFIDCIEQKKYDNISSFSEALKTDIIMDEIVQDAARSLASDGATPGGSIIPKKSREKASMWKRIMK
ncbi:MAG: Gfo/Idh/MocA family oxidoreductase [Proteobacteria bacterium]|nr:Gfo/Idh/MocA family oxidoreductase [Pseudomonadota bacterium]